MDVVPLAAGLALTLLGCVGVYLSFPRQLLVRGDLPSPALRWAGGGLSVAGLVALTGALLPATALLVWATWAMCVLIALPHLVAVRVTAREDD